MIGRGTEGRLVAGRRAGRLRDGVADETAVGVQGGGEAAGVDQEDAFAAAQLQQEPVDRVGEARAAIGVGGRGKGLERGAAGARRRFAGEKVGVGVDPGPVLGPVGVVALGADEGEAGGDAAGIERVFSDASVTSTGDRQTTSDAEQAIGQPGGAAPGGPRRQSHDRGTERAFRKTSAHELTRIIPSIVRTSTG